MTVAAKPAATMAPSARCFTCIAFLPRVCSRRQPLRGRRHPPFGRGPFVPHHRRSEEHTSELLSLRHLVCRLLLEKKHNTIYAVTTNFNWSMALTTTLLPEQRARGGVTARGVRARKPLCVEAFCLCSMFF